MSFLLSPITFTFLNVPNPVPFHTLQFFYFAILLSVLDTTSHVSYLHLLFLYVFVVFYCAFCLLIFFPATLPEIEPYLATGVRQIMAKFKVGPFMWLKAIIHGVIEQRRQEKVSINSIATVC